MKRNLILTGQGKSENPAGNKVTRNKSGGGTLGSEFGGKSEECHMRAEAEECAWGVKWKNMPNRWDGIFSFNR